MSVIKSSCHCGALQLEIESDPPSTLTACNCSICRRYGSLLAYFHPSQVEVIAAPNATAEYSYGEKSLAFIRCKTCGCFSYWRSLEPNQIDRVGVNARLFTNVAIDTIPIRHFDGANSWKYID